MQRTLKFLLFILCLVPFGLLVWGLLTDNLGANPVEELTKQTGIWTLRFLIITLAVTPARHLLGWNGLIRFRRMLGLFAFFYGSLHFMILVVFDHFFSLQAILEDVLKRPFITVGFLGYILLLPLAMTSTTKMIKRLGGKRWQQLHRLIYVIAICGVLHFLWLVKADIRRPSMYIGLLAILLGYRLGRRYYADLISFWRKYA